MDPNTGFCGSTYGGAPGQPSSFQHDYYADPASLNCGGTTPSTCAGITYNLDCPGYYASMWPGVTIDTNQVYTDGCSTIDRGNGPETFLPSDVNTFIDYNAPGGTIKMKILSHPKHTTQPFQT